MSVEINETSDIKIAFENTTKDNFVEMASNLKKYLNSVFIKKENRTKVGDSESKVEESEAESKPKVEESKAESASES